MADEFGEVFRVGACRLGGQAFLSVSLMAASEAVGEPPTDAPRPAWQVLTVEEARGLRDEVALVLAALEHEAAGGS